VPENLVFFDTFTDADNTPLGDHVPELGDFWSIAAGLWEIISNEAQLTSGTQGQAAQLTPSGKWHAVMNFNRQTAGITAAAFRFRVVDALNYWQVNFLSNVTSDSRSLQIVKVVGGSLDTVVADGRLGVGPVAKTMELWENRSGFSVGWEGQIYDVPSSLFSTVDGVYLATIEITATHTALWTAFSIFELVEEGSSMIALRTGQWNVHREGMTQVLEALSQALCAGAALAVTAEIRLFTSANAPGCADTAADYTEADFTGYGPVLVDGDCTDLLEFGVNTDGVGQIVVDQQTFTVGATPTITNSITGAYLVLIVDAVDYLLGTLLFDEAVPMENEGDITKVGGFMLFDCQMVPVA